MIYRVLCTAWHETHKILLYIYVCMPIYLDQGSSLMSNHLTLLSYCQFSRHVLLDFASIRSGSK